MAQGKRYPPELEASWYALWSRGLSDTEIAHETNRQSRQVRHWRLSRGVPRNKDRRLRSKPFGSRDLDYELFEEHLDWAKRTAFVLARRIGQHMNRTAADIAQIGLIGLMQAVVRFDPSYSNFQAFAYQRIRGALLDHARDSSWLSRSEFREGVNAAHVDYDELVKLGHVAPVDSEVRRKIMRAALRRVMAKLSIRERVLLLTFEKDFSLREWGEIYNLSESRASQLRDELVKRIRRQFDYNDLV